MVYESDPYRASFFDYGQAMEKYQGTEWESILSVDPMRYERDEDRAEAMMMTIVQMAEDTPVVAAAPQAKNSLGHWDCFLSNAQTTGGDQAGNMAQRLLTKGKQVWHDRPPS